MISAVLFDIDGVLIDSVRANAWMYRKVCEHFGFQGPSDEEQKELNHLSFKDVVTRLMPGCEAVATGEALRYAQSLEDRSDLLVIPADAIEVLTSLQPTYMLGVVSQRVKPSIGPKLKKIGMAQFFPLQVGYEDTDKHKPDPEPLLFAVEKLGLAANSIVYIGDTEVDIAAGKAAGMKVVLYGPEPLPGVDATAQRFSDIPEIIKSFSSDKK